MKNYRVMFLRHQDAIINTTQDALEVSLDNGVKRFSLNGTAKMVWDLTITPIIIDDIVKNIRHTYERPFLLLRDEVLQFLDDAHHHGLISQYIVQHDVLVDERL